MIQYLAIRTLLEDEVREKNNSLLGQIMKTLIDDDSVSEEEREKIRATVSTVNSHIGNRSGTVVRSQKVNELLPDVIEKGKAWVEEYFSKH
jgi:CRISPR/Cas system CMR subunit Cmr4 (Cas7 group RAMP superfamily)